MKFIIKFSLLMLISINTLFATNYTIEYNYFRSEARDFHFNLKNYIKPIKLKNKKYKNIKISSTDIIINNIALTRFKIGNFKSYEDSRKFLSKITKFIPYEEDLIKH